MQDKYNIDEQFMDQAWGNMEALLDKEMPVQQPKRRLAFWWFFGGIAVSLALFVLYINFNNSTLLEAYSKEKIANKTEINTQNSLLPSTEKKTLVAVEEEEKTIESTAEIITAVNAKTVLSTPNDKQETTNTKALNTSSKSPDSIKKQTIAQASTARETAIGRTTLSEIEPNIQEAAEERIILPDTTVLTRKSPLAVAFLPKGRLLSLPTNSNIELFALNRKLEPKKAKWQHGIFLGWDYSSKLASNLQLAYLAHFQSKQWRISSGVGAAFPLALSQSDLAFSLDESFADQTEIIEPEMDTSISTVDAMLDSNQIAPLNERTANTMFIPFYVRYQKKRFSYFVGGQVAYTFHKSLTDLEIERIIMENNLVTIEEAKNWNYQLGAGLGYQVGKNWNIDLSYQHKLNKSGAALLLGLHYYFD